MRRFLVVCMVAAIALFNTSVSHAIFDTSTMQVDSKVKQLDFDGITTLNDIVIRQPDGTASTDILEVNFDICPKQKGVAWNGTAPRIYYELPYSVDWSAATVTPGGVITPVNVFFTGLLTPGTTGWPGQIFSVQNTHPLMPAGDGARASISSFGTVPSSFTIRGVRIIRNMFPCTLQTNVRATFTRDIAGMSSTETIRAYINRFGTSPAVNVLPASASSEVGLFWCNPNVYHPLLKLLATCHPPCQTWLKFGFVIGTEDYVTVLVVTSDLSTTCNDLIADTVEWYAWDDLGTFLGKADTPTGGSFNLNSGQKSGQALLAVGLSAYTWNGRNTWASINRGGIGQVIARAKQPFAHGLGIIFGPGGIAMYNALTDPSITAIDASGNIQRQEWYAYKEPYLGYIH